MPARVFVTATDTGVGKTEVASALLELLTARGERPFALKPFESGGGDDAARLRRAAGGWQAPKTVCLYRLRAPLAPGIAAGLERRRISWERVRRALDPLGPGSGVVEGAGGLFVPLDERHDVLDLIAEYRLPVVLVARAGLGTINHTTLSMNALHAAGADVAAVVLVKAARGPDASIRHNRGEIERRFPALDVYGPIPYVATARLRRQAFLKALRPLVERLASKPVVRTPRPSAVRSAEPASAGESVRVLHSTPGSWVIAVSHGRHRIDST